MYYSLPKIYLPQNNQISPPLKKFLLLCFQKYHFFFNLKIMIKPVNSSLTQSTIKHM